MARMEAEKVQAAYDERRRDGRFHDVKTAFFERELGNIFESAAADNLNINCFLSAADSAYKIDRDMRVPFAETCHVSVIRSLRYGDQALLISHISDDIADLKKLCQVLNPTGVRNHALAPAVDLHFSFAASGGSGLVVGGLAALDSRKVETLQGFPNGIFPMSYYANIMDQMIEKPLPARPG